MTPREETYRVIDREGNVIDEFSYEHLDPSAFRDYIRTIEGGEAWQSDADGNVKRIYSFD